MKLFLLFTVLLSAGLCLAHLNSGSDEGDYNSQDTEEVGLHERDKRETGLRISREAGEKRKVLKRIVRSTFSGMSGQILTQLESSIISNCKVNGHQEAANTLQTTYDDMKTCFNKKKIFITPKSDFLANIEECSKDAVTKTKSCLSQDQKYFPEFVLDLVKSVASFMYDDVDYMRYDLAPCLPRFNKYSVQRSYIQCLTDTAAQTGDSSQIPTSKASFCQKFIPASYCFTNMIRDNCDRSTNLDKFREDYINSMKGPCDKKESS